MGLIRLIIIALLIWLVWRLISSTLQTLKPRPPAKNDQAPKMVRCLHCGVHVPEHDARWDQDRSFCSEEHRHAWLEHQQH